MRSGHVPSEAPCPRVPPQERWGDSSALECRGEGSRPESPEDFQHTVRSHAGSLVAVARHVLGNDDQAWDAVQEALLSLWLKGEMPPNPRAWLIRTVVHRSLHLRRCRDRRRKHEERACLLRTEMTDLDEPSHRLEIEDLRRMLREALLEIAPEHREVLVLKWLSELDYTSISGRLQIPPGTVRSRLNRSRKALREILLRMLPQDDHDPSHEDNAKP
jgi:RNA polymerase sigma-70 factor, ECF subfamily